MGEVIATRAAYGKALVKLGETHPELLVLDADLSGATMSNGFAKAYPERFFNIGIAEANMTGIAAGLYTTFLEELELACDARVLRRLGAEVKADYSEALGRKYHHIHRTISVSPSKQRRRTNESAGPSGRREYDVFCRSGRK